MGYGTVFLALAGMATMQAVASTKKDSYNNDGLLAEFGLQVARGRFEEKPEEGDLLSEYRLQVAYIRELKAVLASKEEEATSYKDLLGSVSKEAAVYEAIFDTALKDLKDIVAAVAPPIAGESISSDVYIKIMNDGQQKIDQLTRMEAELIAELEEDRKQME